MVGPAIAPGGSSLQSEPKRGFLFLITFIAAMGGLLFGYDFAVLGGAAKFYEAAFHLTDTAAAVAPNAPAWTQIKAIIVSPVGWAQSCALLGCLAGALVSGWLSDRIGRKPILIIAAANFVVSSIGIALVNSFPLFVAWRILGGVSIGLASTASPTYISEIAPASRRGLLVAVNQLTIVTGILLAQFVNWTIAKPETPELSAISATFKALSGEELTVAKEEYQKALEPTWNATDGWRWMFAACAVPSVFFLLGALFVPESPRWLTKAGRTEKAKQILSRIGGAQYAIDAEDEIRATLKNEDAHVRLGELFEKGVRYVLVLGCVLAVLQQWAGINVIINYATDIFNEAGFNMDDALKGIVSIGLVNFLFTFVALFTVDRLGRKPLMVFGFVGLTIIYISVGVCYYMKLHGTTIPPWVFIPQFLLAIATFAMTLGPVVWVLIAEIFPNRIRGTAMSIAIGTLWIACFLLMYSFPIIKALVGPAFTFWVYSGICAAGTAIVLYCLPETKGKSLEQIERELIQP